MEFFLNLFKPIFAFKRIKNGFYLSRADMTECRHVMTHVHPTWQPMCAYVCSHVCACVLVCARVCARVRACVRE